MKELLTELNNRGFNAKSKRPDSDGNVKVAANVSITGDDGKEHWLNRATLGMNDNGEAIYGWVLGDAKKQYTDAEKAEYVASLADES